MPECGDLMRAALSGTYILRSHCAPGPATSLFVVHLCGCLFTCNGVGTRQVPNPHKLIIHPENL